ncbi:MAG: TOTE conflict system archaeo-eukaryotic primase domain-containing protein [Halarcobacter sp.]
MKNKINARLEELYSQKRAIEVEISNLESQLQTHSLKNKKLTKQEKIELFKSLFLARLDRFAKKWISKDGKKQNFFAVTQTFKGNDYIPITNVDIEEHLRGNVQLATYLIDKDNKSKFLVLEVSNDNLKKIYITLKTLGIEALYEYSSYGSILIWLFFETKIETKDARKFAQYILKKSNASGKLFPNRDFCTNASFEEPIELPLHLKFREYQKTVFFDIESSNVIEDQWSVLQNISFISTSIVNKYLDFQNVSSNLAFEDIEFPMFKLDIKLYDYLYIPTLNLSKSFINKLKGFATFDNPQIKILLNLRKPLYNTPRQIKNFEEDEKYLKLPRGLIFTLKSFFHDNRIDYLIDDKTYYQKIETKKVKYDLRDEQKIAISNITKSNFGICVAPPGFGKTLIGAKMFEQRACTTLIIVNKNMLLDQWRQRFVDYFGYNKKDIGFLGKGKNSLNGNIDVATMQSLKNSPDVINDYSFVIVDECHHIPAITFEQIVKQFFGKYILGLSATPNRKDGLEPILFQQLGKVVYEHKKKRTFNNKLKVVKTDFTSTSDNYSTLINEVCLDEDRNNLIIKQLIEYNDRKILVLTDRIEHINILEKKLLEKNISFVSIHGSLSKKEQNEKMSLVESKNLILATSSYFGEGIDFPHLNTIVFATPISYYGRLVQYLGRIGRGNQECLAIDFLDFKNAMLNSTYKKRLEGYKQMHYI